MNVVILQPSYLPWRGVFHQIRMADVFVHYDDVQYDKHGWRNRNRVKTANGPAWLTVPVMAHGNVVEHTPIRDIRIAPDQPWQAKHWRTIEQSYRKAPHFARTAEAIRPFFERPVERLADLTIPLTETLAGLLGITGTRFVRSSDLGGQGTKTDRLLGLLTGLGATDYWSGPAAKEYLEEGKLAAAGIRTHWFAYDYPEYPQLHGAYDGQLSVLDLLCMTGPSAADYIWNRAGVACPVPARP